MKVIIPMAGMGTRMRPHTLVTPKPLLKVAGKSIIARIIHDLFKSTGKKISEVHYVVGNFGIAVEKELLDIAESVNSKGFIHYQDKALGTAHAIYCAKDALVGEVVICFADTLFDGDISISDQEAIIWTKEVKHPESYGIAVTDKHGVIVKFIEKPEKFISNNAIIGIYYFKKAEELMLGIQSLINNKVTKNGEFQLTDSLENLLNNGLIFVSKNVDAWLDCGNKNEFLKSNNYFLNKQRNVINSHINSNNIIVEPVFIGENVTINGCKIGPFVSIEDNCIVEDTILINSILRANSVFKNSVLRNSMIGNSCKITGLKGEVNIGDYAEYKAL
jgi:glucose-1-phosphate thymidylyltransferase